jgi:type II secretory pathway pseudopilin PulG
LAVYHVSDVVQDGGKGRTVSLRGGFRASGFAPKTSCRVEMAARFVIRACRVAGGGVGTKREEKMSEFHSSAVGWVVRARKRGVTLIEAVLFISIALGIIVGGLVFFQQASLAQRTSDAVRTISSISSETRAMYQTETDFAGVAPNVLIAAGAVPSNIVNADGATLQNEWGGVADLSAYVNASGVLSGNTNEPANNEAFVIEYTDIPQAACVRLGTVEEGGTSPIGSGIIGVAISAPGGTRQATDAASGGWGPGDVSGICASGNNTVTWVMGR